MLITYKLFGKSFLKKLEHKLSIISEKKKLKTLNQLLSVDAYILDKLEKRIDQLGCDRILVFQYHKRKDNIVYMTCTHEVVREALTFSENTHNHQDCKLDDFVQVRYLDVPATVQPYFLLKTLDRQVSVVNDIQKLKTEHLQLYKELSSRNIKGFILSPVINRDSNDSILGFVLFEYCYRRPQPTAEYLEKIKLIASRIATLLNSPEVYYEEYIDEILNIRRKDTKSTTQS